MPRGKKKSFVPVSGDQIVMAYGLIRRPKGLYAVRAYQIQGDKVLLAKDGIDGFSGSVDNPKSLLVGYLGIKLMEEDR